MVQGNTPRVLISGAGIAGLTAAYWLHQAGWEVVIVEKTATLREGDFIFDLHGTGWDVAVRMGIDDDLKARQTTIDTFSFRNAQGAEQTRLSADRLTGTDDISGRHVSINRRDLQHVLHEKVRDTVDFRYSTTIITVKESPGDYRVQVAFDNGPEESFDLVIGADGLHSPLRNTMFGHEKQFSTYLGYYVAAYRAPVASGDDSQVMQVLRSPGKQVSVIDVGNAESLALFLFAKERETPVPVEGRPLVLQETFSDMGGVVPRILDSITPDAHLYMDTTTQISMRKWHTNRVALVGDAAHCLTLISGQGASLAMGGAYVLATELQKVSVDQVPLALSRYQRRLKAFTEQLQETTQKRASRFVPSSKLTTWAATKALRFAPGPLTSRLATSHVKAPSFFEWEGSAA